MTNKKKSAILDIVRLNYAYNYILQVELITISAEEDCIIPYIGFCGSQSQQGRLLLYKRNKLKYKKMAHTESGILYLNKTDRKALEFNLEELKKLKNIKKAERAIEVIEFILHITN